MVTALLHLLRRESFTPPAPACLRKISERALRDLQWPQLPKQPLPDDVAGAGAIRISARRAWVRLAERTVRRGASLTVRRYRPLLRNFSA